MKKILVMVVLVCLQPLLLTSCGQAPVMTMGKAARTVPQLTWHDAAHPAPAQLPAGTTTGMVVFDVRTQGPVLAVRAIPQNTSTVDVVLTGTQLTEPFALTLTTEQLAGGQAIFSVAGLPIGSYTLDVAAKDAAGATLATGRATITVGSGGTVVPVHLLLGAPPAGGDGGLDIRIETPITVSPTMSYPTGTVTGTVS